MILYVVLLTACVLHAAVAAGDTVRCSTHADCTASLGDGAQCNSAVGQCTCQDKFAYDSSTGRCLYIVSSLGDYCSAQTQLCLLEADKKVQLVECRAGRCLCSNGSIASLDKTRCIKVRKLNDSCQNSNECTATMGDGAECASNKCICQTGFIYRDNVCSYKLSRLGDQCQPPYQTCYVDADGERQKLQCINGKCQNSSASTVGSAAMLLVTMAVAMCFRAVV